MQPRPAEREYGPFPGVDGQRLALRLHLHQRLGERLGAVNLRADEELSEIEAVAKADLGIPPANYVFLFMFDMCSQMIRKNPLAVIQALTAITQKVPTTPVTAIGTTISRC